MTNRIKSVVYGEGGYDETKPNSNIIATEYYTDEELAIVEAEETKTATRQTLLAKLGITEEEAKLLLS